MGSLPPAVQQQLAAIERQDAIYAARQLEAIAALAARNGDRQSAFREIYRRCCMVIWTCPKAIHGRFHGIARTALKGLERA